MLKIRELGNQDGRPTSDNRVETFKRQKDSLSEENILMVGRWPSITPHYSYTETEEGILLSLVK